MDQNTHMDTVHRVKSLEKIIERHEIVLVKQESELKALTRAVDQVAANVKHQDNIVGRVEECVKSVLAELREFKKSTDEQLDAMKQKPAHNWEAIKAAAIGAVVVGLIGYVMFKLGLK